MTTVTVYDATHDNIGRLPHGRAAGYSTGSHGVRWTAADWAAHPGAVRIDQDPAASDPTADVLDVEGGAASPGDCPGWVRRARANFASASRPGQRRPAIYVNRSNKTAVANELTAANLSGVGLWLADPDMTEAAAIAEVNAAAGPFPVIGVQHKFAQFYDVSVFSLKWIEETVAHPDPPKPPMPPGQWADPQFWTWKQVVTGGQGLDGKFHLWALEGNQWVKVL